MLKTTYRSCRSLLDGIGIFGPRHHASLHPAIRINQDLGNEHYSSFGRLKTYVTLQNPLGQGSLPRLTQTHNFDTTKKNFFRRSSRQAPLRPRMLVPFSRASFHRIMNLLHILAGCFYRLAQGVYTSRIFTQTTRRLIWVAGFLHSEGQGASNKRTHCYPSHGYSGWSKPLVMTIRKGRLGFTSDQIGISSFHMAWHGIR